MGRDDFERDYGELARLGPQIAEATAMIEQLMTTRRDLILKYHKCGGTWEEIAQLTGTKRSTAYSRWGHSSS